MRRFWLAMLAAHAGCDRVLSLEPRPLPDDAAQPCEVGGAFTGGEPVPIAGTYSVEAARFNGTQSIAYLSLCAASGDVATCDLYASPFTAATRTFTSFTKLGGVSTLDVYDSYPTITPDGEHLLFGSRRLDGAIQVWVASAVNSSFDMPTLTRLALPTGKTTSNEPYILGDGATVYFSSGPDLYRTSGPPPEFGATPVNVPGINTGNLELSPVVSDDERELFFASDREQPGSLMGLDIYAATRTTTDAAFGTPQRIAELSTSGTTDWPVWLSPDRCSLFYIHKPVASLATLYVAHRR